MAVDRQIYSTRATEGIDLTWMGHRLRIPGWAGWFMNMPSN